MKKFFILLLLVLTGCTQETFDVEAKLAEGMNSTANFRVSEVFKLNHYGVYEEQPHNRIVEIENVIEYHNNVIYTESDMSYETDFLGVEERGSYTFDSYKDLLSDIGYVRPVNDWYAVELPQMYKLGMGSIDPIGIVNAILYENVGITYRGIDQITVEPSLYRIAIAELPSDVFESLFASSIYNFVDIDYDYTVTATMRFDENYRVEYIDFDLEKMIQQYSDYYEYEIGSTINSVYGSYKLLFDTYGEVVISPVDEYIDWVLDDDYEIEVSTEELPENEVGTVKADVVYDDETNIYATTISIEMAEDLRYMYYELYFYRDGEAIRAPYYSEYYNVEVFDDLVLFYLETDVDIDEVYFVTRYIPDDSSEVFAEAGYADVFVVGPVHDVELDFDIYNDSADELIPNLLIESLGINNGEISYELTLDLYALEDTREGNAAVYLYENNILKEIIRFSDFNINKYDDFRFTQTVNFKPEQVYMDLSYKTSYLWFNEKHITMDFHLIEEPMDFSEYNDEIDVRTYEIDDPKWYASKYLISFDFPNDVDVLDVYVYFVNEEGEVVGWEHIFDFNVEDTYEVVSDIYEEDIETIYLSIDADGIQYKIIGIYGIIVQ